MIELAKAFPLGADFAGETPHTCTVLTPRGLHHSGEPLRLPINPLSRGIMCGLTVAREIMRAIRHESGKHLEVDWPDTQAVARRERRIVELPAIQPRVWPPAADNRCGRAANDQAMQRLNALGQQPERAVRTGAHGALRRAEPDDLTVSG